MAKRKRDSVTISPVEELPFLSARSANHPPGFNTDPPASFYLPQFSVPGPYSNNDGNVHLARSSPFSANTLAAAIQNNCSLVAIKRYIASYDLKLIDCVDRVGVTPLEDVTSFGCACIFFAIQQNSPEILQALLDLGLDPNVMSASEPSLPAVVFAIISSKWTLRDPTAVVEILLAYGADPASVPVFFWRSYLLQLEALDESYIKMCLSAYSLTVECICGASKTAWIADPGMNAALIETFHLTLRYMFFRASKVPLLSKRRSQMYKAANMQDILRLPFYTCQPVASKLVVENLFAYQCLTTNLKAPLVMVFAGFPGHGQIELAEIVGKLLSAPLKVVDCSQITSKDQLFTGSFSGSPKFYQHSGGSTLVKFLSNVAGQRAVVLFDNFDDLVESCPCVQDEFLRTMRSGIYASTATHTTIDTSKIIWILNTNFGSSEIFNASEEGIEIENEESLKILQNTLFSEATMSWRENFTSLVRTFVPFLAFKHSERAVALHKLLLQLSEDVRRPVDLTPNVERYVGHIHLNIANTEEMCDAIADSHMDSRLGALAFSQTIEEIKTKLCATYTEVEEEVVETADCTLQAFELSFQPLLLDGQDPFRPLEPTPPLFNVTKKDRNHSNALSNPTISKGHGPSLQRNRRFDCKASNCVTVLVRESH